MQHRYLATDAQGQLEWWVVDTDVPEVYRLRIWFPTASDVPPSADTLASLIDTPAEESRVILGIGRLFDALVDDSQDAVLQFHARSFIDAITSATATEDGG